MSIDSKIKKRMSPSLYGAIDEVMSIIDTSVDYEYIHSHSLERFKSLIYKFRNDKEQLDNTVHILLGDVTLYPDIRVDSDYALVILKSQKLIFDRVEETRTILSYEKIINNYTF